MLFRSELARTLFTRRAVESWGIGRKSMVRFKIYIEGGGDSSDQDSEFRRGWTRFFEKAGLKGKMPAVVRGGGRQATFDSYCDATKRPKPGVVAVLLVDSEGPVTAGEDVWLHLQQRDNWQKLSHAPDNTAFLMIQMTEHWFVADRNALAKFFGHGFKMNELPQWSSIESVSKEAVTSVLNRATQECKQKYQKGSVSFELIGLVDPARVANECPAAAKLLSRLSGG